jgi:hypothetical protein
MGETRYIPGIATYQDAARRMDERRGTPGRRGIATLSPQPPINSLAWWGMRESRERRDQDMNDQPTPQYPILDTLIECVRETTPGVFTFIVDLTPTGYRQLRAAAGLPPIIPEQTRSTAYIHQGPDR